MKITLTNDYHGTSYTLNAKVTLHGRYEVKCATVTLTELQVRKAKRALCPLEECNCGGVAGERGGECGVRVEAIPRYTIFWWAKEDQNEC